MTPGFSRRCGWGRVRVAESALDAFIAPVVPAQRSAAGPGEPDSGQQPSGETATDPGAPEPAQSTLAQTAVQDGAGKRAA